jgi:hypothetical protein
VGQKHIDAGYRFHMGRIGRRWATARTREAGRENINRANAARWTQSLSERFWSKVQKTDCCWNWIGSITDGYGYFKVGGKTLKATRVSWELANGPIPEGLWMLHHCDNRKCVRPDHLFPGTQQDNVDDMMAKGRNFTKLTAENVAEIRFLRAGGMTQREIGERFNVTQSCIYLVLSRRLWKRTA